MLAGIASNAYRIYQNVVSYKVLSIDFLEA